MFRALFIGLLILSTFSSEGIIGFPQNAYNLYLCLESRLNAAEEVAPTPEHKMKDGERGSFSCHALKYETFVLSQASVKKFEAKLPANIFTNLYKGYIDFHIPVKPGTIHKIKSDRVQVLQKADTSPPQSGFSA